MVFFDATFVIIPGTSVLRTEIFLRKAFPLICNANATVAVIIIYNTFFVQTNKQTNVDVQTN